MFLSFIIIDTINMVCTFLNIYVRDLESRKGIKTPKNRVWDVFRAKIKSKFQTQFFGLLTPFLDFRSHTVLGAQIYSQIFQDK